MGSIPSSPSMKCKHICTCKCHEKNFKIKHFISCCEIFCCHCSERIDREFSQFGNKEHNDKCHDGKEMVKIELERKLTKEEYIKELIRLAKDL